MLDLLALNDRCPKCGVRQFGRCYAAHLMAWLPGRDEVVACSNCHVPLRFEPNRSPYPPLAGVLGLVPLICHSYFDGTRSRSVLLAVAFSLGIILFVSLLRSRVMGIVELVSRDEKIAVK